MKLKPSDWRKLRELKATVEAPENVGTFDPRGAAEPPSPASVVLSCGLKVAYSVSWFKGVDKLNRYLSVSRPGKRVPEVVVKDIMTIVQIEEQFLKKNPETGVWHAIVMETPQ